VDPTRFSVLTNPHPRHHIVYPYTDEARITNAVNAFTSSGISKGESVVLILADAHHEPIRQTLRNEGFDFAALEGAGQLEWISAEGLLRKVMSGGAPDERLFKTTVGEIMERARAGSPTGKVRMVGEMVGLLFSAKNIAAAERMEELWNETIEASAVALLCTYALDGTQAVLPESLVQLHTHEVGSAVSLA
jgi:MEDS: MEthanogen/methylotroph, DcmR Sensory domain